MKRFKAGWGRGLLLMLALLMALGTVACGKKRPHPSEGTTQPVEEEKDSLPDMTFDHTDFTFLIRDYVDYINDIAITALGEQYSSVDERV